MDLWKMSGESETERKLAALGFDLGALRQHVARNSYVPSVLSGHLLFVSGQGPRLDGTLKYTGKVGSDRTIEEAYQAARLCAANLLSQVDLAVGSLAHVDRIVRVAGLVNCVADFERHPDVIDGASDLLIEILGERGRHARIATGTSSLPGGMTVEVEACFAIAPETAARLSRPASPDN